VTLEPERLLDLIEHGQRAVGVIAEIEVLIGCDGSNNDQNGDQKSFAAHLRILAEYESVRSLSAGRLTRTLHDAGRPWLVRGRGLIKAQPQEVAD
jgi:hypothetical protein